MRINSLIDPSVLNPPSLPPSLPPGKGTLVYPDGSILKCTFQNDKAEGEGLLAFANGDVYEGRFKVGREGYREGYREGGREGGRMGQARTTTNAEMTHSFHS